jgi:hypothetical protein
LSSVFHRLNVLQVKLCYDDSMLWASLAVALLCCIQQGANRRTDAADDAADAADDDVDDWIAESVARAQHCFATAERIDPRCVHAGLRPYARAHAHAGFVLSRALK